MLFHFYLLLASRKLVNGRWIKALPAVGTSRAALDGEEFLNHTECRTQLSSARRLRLRSSIGRKKTRTAGPTLGVLLVRPVMALIRRLRLFLRIFLATVLLVPVSSYGGGKRVHDLELPDLAGHTQKLSSLRGQI